MDASYFVPRKKYSDLAKIFRQIPINAAGRAVAFRVQHASVIAKNCT